MSAVTASPPARGITFRPASRQKARLRMALDGVSGSGKSFTALRFAFSLGKRVAVINAENEGAIEFYKGLSPDGTPFEFDVCYLPDFSPTSYTAAILQAGKEGYDVLVIDSLSHAWAGVGGALELKDRKGGNSFTAWKDITPMHNRMIDAILRSPCHVIATMRSKQAYVLEADGQGKQVPRKVGMEPIQRWGMEYEFDIYGNLDDQHVLKISKSRCPEVDGAVAVKPGAAFMEPVIRWLNEGSSVSADHFAVTETDLRKFEKRVAEYEKKEAASQPRKSAMELIQEAASRANGGDSTAGAKAEMKSAAATPAAAAASESNSSAPPLATREQIERLTTLYVNLGVTGDTQQQILAAFKVGSFRSLTQEQIAKLIGKAEEKWAIRQKEAAAAAESAAAESVPFSADPPSPSTNEQQAEIQELFKQYMQVDPAAAMAFKDKLQAVRGPKGALKTLSHADAERLKAALQNKQLANFFQVSLETWQPAEVPAGTNPGDRDEAQARGPDES